MSKPVRDDPGIEQMNSRWTFDYDDVAVSNIDGRVATSFKVGISLKRKGEKKGIFVPWDVVDKLRRAYR